MRHDLKHLPHVMIRAAQTSFFLRVLFFAILISPVFAEQESNNRLSAQRGPAWLAPDYSIIAQLPPKQVAGFFMAMSLAKMPSGALVAAVPKGEKEPEGGQALPSLHFYRSTDKGATWKAVSELPYDSCEPNLFVHEGKLYLIITPQQNNHARSERLKRSHFPKDGKWGIWACVSDDEGATWSTIHRVLQGDGQIKHMTGGHSAMVIRNGRLYLTVSHHWLGLAAVSCQLDQGLLNPDAWRISELAKFTIPPGMLHDYKDNPGGLRCLEGNVVEVKGRLLVIARVGIQATGGNMAAVFEILDDEKKEEPLRIQFLQFYSIPGGNMKFYILYDAPSGLFWMASSPSIDNSWSNDRRTLMLWYSTNSLNWIPAGWIAYAKPGSYNSFHYPVMVIDDKDLAIISRTGRDSGDNHNVDLATFHRIENFRDLAVHLPGTGSGGASSKDKGE